MYSSCPPKSMLAVSRAVAYTPSMSLNIVIVCGSVREDRKSILAANYAAGLVKEAGHNAEVVDFVKSPLPFVDTPVAPGDLKGNYPYEEVMQWSKVASNADAFIFAIPEYNHGYSGVFKNAIDWLYREFHHKPVALVGVSNGSVGGARVIEQVRAVCGAYALYDIKENVMVRKVQDVFDENGQLLQPIYEKQFKSMIQALVDAGIAMKQLRK